MRRVTAPSSSSSLTSSSSSSSAIVHHPHNHSNNNTTMSTTADTVTSDVCRDFMRNVCTRGNKCRYYHPPNVDSKPSNVSTPVYVSAAAASSDKPPSSSRLQDSIVFCHDHSNHVSKKNTPACPRENCRYLHCSAEEEQEYRSSGYLPPHLRDQSIRKGIAPDMPTLFGGKPICKDFLKGDCKR